WGRMSVAFKCRGLRLLLFMYSDDEEVLSCPEHQQAFESSCYEFVALQRSFLSAQAWCERGGGHLSFIQNDETQQFLQKHLQPKQDWWIGLAPASTNLTLDSALFTVLPTYLSLFLWKAILCTKTKRIQSLLHCLSPAP
uniref:C-type lectin domain-containing protein n=1 Tax=Sinocyclocheilus grahami TaxID=75366 RepID=A0A672K146_SINGR